MACNDDTNGLELAYCRIRQSSQAASAYVTVIIRELQGSRRAQREVVPGTGNGLHCLS